MAKKKKKTTKSTARQKKPFGAFKDVPAGSRFEAWIEDDQGKFNADGQFIGSTTVTNWKQSDLMPNPATSKKLEAGRSYFGRIRLAFLAAGKATVVCRVVRSDGTIHSKALKWEVKGKKGSVAIRGAFVNTE